MPPHSPHIHPKVLRGVRFGGRARRDLVMMLASGLTLNLLLTQIPATTLADMSAPKNGLSLMGVLVCGVLSLSPSVWSRLLRRVPRRPAWLPGPGLVPARQHHGALSSWWLAAFVCVLYPHALVWLSVLTLAILSSVCTHAARPESERAEVLALLGFSVDRVSAAPLGSRSAQPAEFRHNLLVIMAVAAAAMTHLGYAWSRALVIPQALYQLPLYILAVGYFWAKSLPAFDTPNTSPP